ncbi:MAG: serine hydrolase [Planctomycetes bacterium]|nr:serine hydrolase [Planctomycetota bacterium]
MNQARPFSMILPILLHAAGCAGMRPPAAPRAPEYWPTEGWRVSTPERQGLDSGKLAETFDYIHDHDLNIHSLLIIRNGYLVLEATFYPYDGSSVHDVASVTKSVTTTLVGIAIDQGLIRIVREPVLNFFPGRPIANRVARKEKMAVEHLLTMSSGLDCHFESSERTLRDMMRSEDWIQFMLDLPMAEEPGRKFVYCSGGMHLLSGIISRAAGMDALSFARQQLFAPLGIGEAIWPADRQGMTHGWGDLHLKPRDMAKIGFLWLNRGQWDGRQIVSEKWVAESIRKHQPTGKEEGYGYGWWVKPDFYEASGRVGQRIIVFPEKNLIAVFTGGGFEPGEVGKLLQAAFKSDSPLPENPAALARLAERMDAAARPPAPRPAPPLPDMAKSISGKIYALEPNFLGLKAISLTFPSPIEASIQATFTDGRREARPIGLEGVLRLSPGGRFGLPAGLKGSWTESDSFQLEHDEIANLNCFRLQMRFEGDRVSVHATERTGLLDASFGGTS